MPKLHSPVFQFFTWYSLVLLYLVYAETTHLLTMSENSCHSALYFQGICCEKSPHRDLRRCTVPQSESLIPSLHPPDDIHILLESLSQKTVDENALLFLSVPQGQPPLPFQNGPRFSFLSSSN